ncbi:hypothetical protein PQR75_45305 [Paraburkholderia fungorum]|uniref:hypothetical protein n=1 Tax=Paraburkholderia fungorum TaxID=134537 RepID=UPI0038BDE926
MDALSSEHISKARRWFGIALAFSILFTAVLIVSSFGEFETTFSHAGRSIDDFKRGVACIKHLITAIGADELCEAGHASSAGGHPGPDLPIGLTQILGVVSISFLWFNTFVLDDWRYTVAAGMITVLFVLAMFNSYQPAVFVAALVAIFAAAEHFESLTKQSQWLNTLIDKTLQVANSSQLSLNDAGQKLFTQYVHGAYLRADTIYAVLRYHEIDPNWMRHAHEDLNAAWEWYDGLKLSPKKEDRTITFLQSLTAPRELPDLVEGGPGKSRVTSAYFVTAMPFPGAAEWPSETEKRRRAEMFENLVGLAWECRVLRTVRKEVGNHDAVGMWVSRPLTWIHATNKEVWQVIKRGRFENSTVLKIADPAVTRLNDLEKEMSDCIIEAGQAEIRLYLQRGAPAEEYLTSILIYASESNVGAQLDADMISSILKKLGLIEWSEKVRDEKQQERRREIAISIFHDFINTCMCKPCAPDMPVADVNKVIGLAREIL